MLKFHVSKMNWECGGAVHSDSLSKTGKGEVRKGGTIPYPGLTLGD